MLACPRRVAALIALAITAFLMVGGAAQAAVPPSSGENAKCALPPASDDDAISILGRICDRRDTPQSPVEGVEITVEDSAGKPVGTATSGADGTFEIKLPGSSVSNLGKTFVVKVNEDTLPEGTSLAKSDLERKVAINLDNDQSITFPIGEAPGQSTGKGVQALQLLIGGIVFSVLLAMAALGLSMIFGTTGLTNFAHGELITFGAIVAYTIDQLPGAIRIGGVNLTVVVALIAAFFISGAFGWLNDAALWRPLRRRGTGVIAMMIVSIGLSIFLRNVFQFFSGAQSHNYSQYSAVKPWEIGPILLTPKELMVTIVGVSMLVAVSLLLQFTRIGKATRAVSDNPALASSSGINVERVIAVVWIVGTALAGLSGALLGLTQGFDYQIGFKILLLVFAAVVLGGLGTIWGAMVGAFIIGIFIELSTLFIPAELKFVGALVVLIVVLLIRPQGLLGKAQRVG
ncbi:branched-chain amino acid ABC transporter permease [Nocardioides mesophilus]|uniref:Branched-chain amino acid ABC transporter permease n=1 Tax=Nocardioides mesophilus TaxID=433659 RepID=A0A7G9RBS0_9ACTN|nr:branched-chain amino acid ABC transporter permease [Nocardioides mesophilus]QNN53045.1 branched-chain amino acid ABC transporter permease [Nocardioides mesophilus]